MLDELGADWIVVRSGLVYILQSAGRDINDKVRHHTRFYGKHDGIIGIFSARDATQEGLKNRIHSAIDQAQPITTWR